MKQGIHFFRFAAAVFCIWLVWPLIFRIICGVWPPTIRPEISIALVSVVTVSVNSATKRLLKVDQRRTQAVVTRLEATTWDDLPYVLDIRGQYFSGPIFDAAGRAIARLLRCTSLDQSIYLTAENRKTLVAELQPEQCYTHPEIVLAVLKLTDLHVLMEARTAVDRLSQLNVEDRRIRGIVLLARSLSVKFVKQASLEALHKHLLRPTEPTTTLLMPREGLGSEPKQMLVRPAVVGEILDNCHTEL